MANTIKITVGGMNYSISGDESAEYLNELGDELEKKLKYFTKKNPFISTTMVAIMAALECGDEAKKAKAENEKLRKSINYLEEALEEERKRNAHQSLKSPTPGSDQMPLLK